MDDHICELPEQLDHEGLVTERDIDPEFGLFSGVDGEDPTKRSEESGDGTKK